MEIYVENESKLTLHGLQQYYVKLKPEEKNRKLADLLDELEFNQVVVFVSKVVRARELDRLLKVRRIGSNRITVGDHLCCAVVGVQLPQYPYPWSDEAGRAYCKVQRLPQVRAPHSGGHQPVWARH
jgi:hypothetical protein